MYPNTKVVQCVLLLSINLLGGCICAWPDKGPYSLVVTTIHETVAHHVHARSWILSIFAVWTVFQATTAPHISFSTLFVVGTGFWERLMLICGRLKGISSS